MNLTRRNPYTSAMKTKTISPSNEAIGQIMHWLEGQPQWSAAFSLVVDRQRQRVTQQVFAGEEDSFDRFAEYMGSQLFGWAFETFLSGRIAGHAPDSPIDDFLKRRAWRLNPLGQRYLRAVRDSAPTLLEVLDVVSGRYVDVTDMIVPGEPFRVYERMGSRQLQRWDRLCARVVEMPEGRVFTGAILPLTGRDTMPFVGAAREAIQRLTEQVAVAGTTVERFGELVRQALRDSADDFLVLWVAQAVAAAMPPRIVNSDGDPIIFHTRRYQLRPGVRGRVIAALSGNGELKPTSARPHQWSWVQAPEDHAASQDAAAGLALDSRDIGDPIRVNAASLELKAGVLTVETNSAARLQRVEQWLLPLLGADVLAVTTEARTLEQARAEAPEKDAPRGREIPRQLREELEREFLEKHYHAWIDMQLPALHGATPREAAADPKRCGAVVDLLKEMENRSAHATAQGHASFDFSTVWQALGLAHLRS
jgi:hypothetical protein